MHGIGIVGVCGPYLPVLESPTAGRGHQHRMSATLPDFVNERFQACGEGIISSPSRPILFLVVVPELHEHVVARFHLRQGFLQPSGTDESVGTFAALRIIGKAYFRIEETGNHLSPTGPRLFVLVHHGRVSGQEQGRDTVVRFNPNGRTLRTVTVDFNRKLVIPVQLGSFTRFDTHRLGIGDFRCTFVDCESKRAELPFLRRHAFQKQAARLRPYRGNARLLAVTQKHRDAIVPVGYLHGDIIRAVAAFVRRGEQVIAVPLSPAYNGLRETTGVRSTVRQTTYLPPPTDVAPVRVCPKSVATSNQHQQHATRKIPCRMPIVLL